ncbi:MAG TPA: hypothetical protein VFD62_02250 [Pyrinomonadaceae bacterium]|nr:hypothetical protein [Pyrinomonadaceae bacterium]
MTKRKRYSQNSALPHRSGACHVDTHNNGMHQRYVVIRAVAKRDPGWPKELTDPANAETSHRKGGFGHEGFV